MLVPLVVEEMCCGAGALSGEQKWSTSRTRCRSRSAQHILDVSVPFISEQRFQLTTWEAEPEAVQSVPQVEVCLRLRQSKEAVEEHGATAGMHHVQVM